MAKKTMSMVLTLLFTCLAFFDFDEFGLSISSTHQAWAFFPELHFQGLHCTLSEIYTKFGAYSLFLCSVPQEITLSQIHNQK
jgi:hypothetical protein